MEGGSVGLTVGGCGGGREGSEGSLELGRKGGREGGREGGRVGGREGGREGGKGEERRERRRKERGQMGKAERRRVDYIWGGGKEGQAYWMWMKQKSFLHHSLSLPHCLFSLLML